MNDRQKTFEVLKRIAEKSQETIAIQAACNLDGKSPVEKTLVRIGDILASIAVERTRQELKWGIQELPDRHVTDGDCASFDEMARFLRTAAQAFPQEVSWNSILLEEVYEALAESEPEKIIEELIQVAAVCCSWIENLAAR